MNASLNVTFYAPEIVEAIAKKMSGTFTLEKTFESKEFGYAEYDLKNFKVRHCEVAFGIYNGVAQTIILKNTWSQTMVFLNEEIKSQVNNILTLVTKKIA